MAYLSPNYVVNTAWVIPHSINGALNMAVWSLTYDKNERARRWNRRLKKMYVEERLKTEIIQEAMAKSGESS